MVIPFFLCTFCNVYSWMFVFKYTLIKFNQKVAFPLLYKIRPPYMFYNRLKKFCWAVLYHSIFLQYRTVMYSHQNRMKLRACMGLITNLRNSILPSSMGALQLERANIEIYNCITVTTSTLFIIHYYMYL